MINRPQTPINPKGFTNQNNIQKVFGSANPGTFTRTVGDAVDFTGMATPPPPPTDPLTGLAFDPTMDQSPNAPVPPPTGVQLPVTPPYGLNTY